nr:polyprenol monophosphomannose synthase [Pajaroellobacter abortibovis]
MSTLIVVPTYNERENLPLFLEQVRQVVPDADVLVVDDRSPDGTGRIADEWAACDSHVRVLHRSGKLGLGTAYLKAFQLGLKEEYECFFEMDADLSHSPKYLPQFLNSLERGGDVVIGSRNIEGGGIEGWGIGRHILSKGGSFYARSILGAPIRDWTSGYKAFSRRALEAIDLSCVRSNGYSFQIELTYRAFQKGMNIVEIPIMFVDRKQGHSKMNHTIFMEAVGMVWKLRYEAWRGLL